MAISITKITKWAFLLGGVLLIWMFGVGDLLLDNPGLLIFFGIIMAVWMVK